MTGKSENVLTNLNFSLVNFVKIFDRDEFFGLLEKFLEGEGLSTDWETLQQADSELLINSLSMMLDFDSEDKQALLEAPSLQTRRETLTTLFEFSLRGGSDDEVLQ